MPPTGRRGRARKEPLQEPSDADTAEMMNNTPSRKRRRVNGSATNLKPAKVARAESAETEVTVTQENDEDEDNTWNKQLTYAARFIKKLRVATYPVNAATELSNDFLDSQSPTAFARVSGRNWTYFVRDTTFNIGRPVRAQQAKRGVDTSPSAGSQNNGASFPINIDLGPDQQVSRVHAVVEFVPEQEIWVIRVNGRNGLLVDDRRLEKGDQAHLHSGAVISIVGTQMMFTLPEADFTVHPSILSQFNEDGDSEEEQTQDRMPPAPPRGPTSGTRQNGSQLYPQPQGLGNGAPQTRSHQAATSAASNPGTPLTVRSRETIPRSKPSPAYGRGMVIETTEDIDYSADTSRDIKPPHSYAQLIGQAILQSEEEKCTLAKIYEFIKEHYAFYRHSGGGWQNSIRHNLSLSKCFEKVARRTDEPGKGMKWQIVPEHRDEFLKKNMTKPHRGLMRVGSSGPNSPAAGGPSGSVHATERLHGVLNRSAMHNVQAHGQEMKTSPRGDTPPLGSYPTANESYTPERGPRHVDASNDSMPTFANGGSTIHTPNYSRTSTNLSAERNSYASNAANANARTAALAEAAANSPPMLGPLEPGTAARSHGIGSLYADYPNTGLAMQTPLSRHKPRLAPPSTAHLPSTHMLFSSPAPFWKYADLGSTPARPYEASPEKKEQDDSADDGDEGDETMVVNKQEEEHDETAEAAQTSDAPVTVTEEAADTSAEKALPQASSPPVPLPNSVQLNIDGLGDSADDDNSPVDDVSPSRTISRPVSRQLPGGPPPAQAPMPKLNLGTAPVLSATSGAGTGPVRATASAPKLSGGDEEAGIDLAKGFQRIGSFHRSLSLTTGQASGLGIAQPAGGIVAPRT